MALALNSVLSKTRTCCHFKQKVTQNSQSVSLFSDIVTGFRLLLPALFLAPATQAHSPRGSARRPHPSFIQCPGVVCHRGVPGRERETGSWVSVVKSNAEESPLVCMFTDGRTDGLHRLACVVCCCKSFFLWLCPNILEADTPL